MLEMRDLFDASRKSAERLPERDGALSNFTMTLPKKNCFLHRLNYYDRNSSATVQAKAFRRCRFLTFNARSALNRGDRSPCYEVTPCWQRPSNEAATGSARFMTQLRRSWLVRARTSARLIGASQLPDAFAFGAGVTCWLMIGVQTRWLRERRRQARPSESLRRADRR